MTDTPKNRAGVTADINNTGDNWIQVTLSGPGVALLTEEMIETALGPTVDEMMRALNDAKNT